MSQNSEQIEARLAAYIDGELNDAERAEIEKHLEANPQHKALIEELTGQRDLLRALPHEKAPPEIAETIQQQLERSVLLGSGAEGGDGPILRISRWPHRGAIAAIILLTAGLGFLVYKVLPSNKPPAEFAVAPKESGPATAPLVTDEKSETSVADAEKLAAKPQMRDSADGTKRETTEDDRGRQLKTAAADKSANETVAVAPPQSALPAPSATPASPAPAPANELSLNTNSAAPAPVTPAPATPTPESPTEDQSKPGAALNGGLAMVPSSGFNSAAAGNPPLANAIGSAERANKNGDFSAKGGPGGARVGNAGSVCLVVSTDDPAAAAEQVRTYLSNNRITWESASAPIQIGQNEFVAANRMRSQELQLQRNGELAKALPPDADRYGGFGGGGAGGGGAGAANRGIMMKDISPERRAEAEAIAKQKAGEQAAGKQMESPPLAQAAPASQPTVSDAVQSQANTPVTTGGFALPATQPAGQSTQYLGDSQIEPAAYYCRNVTPQQAQELQGVLSSRPGQSTQVIPTQVIPQTTALDVVDANSQLNAAPTTAPATQPIVTFGAAQSDQANVSSQQALTLQQQLQQPADQQVAGNFDLQQPAPTTQPAAGEPQQAQVAEPLVDLLIVVRKESPTTQPSTGAANQAVPQQPAINAP